MGSLSMTGTLNVASWEVIFGKMRDEKLEKSCKLGMVDYYSGDFVDEPRQTRYGFPGGTGACLCLNDFGYRRPHKPPARKSCLCMQYIPPSIHGISYILTN